MSSFSSDLTQFCVSFLKYAAYMGGGGGGKTTLPPPLSNFCQNHRNWLIFGSNHKHYIYFMKKQKISNPLIISE